MGEAVNDVRVMGRETEALPVLLLSSVSFPGRIGHVRSARIIFGMDHREQYKSQKVASIKVNFP